MPAQLIALTEGPNILVDKPVLLVGRHPECDILIDSRKISRRHCCIAQVDTYLVVRDLGSTNGIRINGVRVLEGRLRPQDELTIGNTRYKVRWDSVEIPPDPLKMGAIEVQKVFHEGDVDDEVLESCDQPVALDEPAASRSRPASVREVPPPVMPGSRKAAAAPGGDESLILPDDIHLAPLSDEFKQPPAAGPK